jgi:hypothetical protein
LHKDEKEDFFDSVAAQYLGDIAAQTKGSYRVRSANAHGSSLVRLLRLMRGTAAEQSISGYLARAQQRVQLASQHTAWSLRRDERVALVTLLLERLAFEEVLKLDRMEALGAIDRVRRCDHCGSWFWGRVRNQRYCSGGCRVRHYHASPAGRKYKREWARKDYQRNKKRDEEAREVAKRIASRTRAGRGARETL